MPHMPDESTWTNGELAAATVAVLTSHLGRPEAKRHLAGAGAVIALIQARFVVSRTDTILFASFLRVPGDQALQGKVEFALERSAGDDDGFRDQLTHAIKALPSHDQPSHDQPGSKAGNGTSNTTTVTGSTIKGRGHNLGILNRSNRLTVGLGGLAALALIGGGVYTLVPSHRHSPPSPIRSLPAQRHSRLHDGYTRTIPPGDAVLPDGLYVYTATTPDSSGKPGYDVLMMRWTMNSGYGNGGLVIADRSVNINGVNNAGLTVQGTISNLSLTFDPSLGRPITEPAALSGSTLTFSLPNGPDGMTSITFHRSTLQQWRKLLAAYEKVTQ